MDFIPLYLPLLSARLSFDDGADKSELLAVAASLIPGQGITGIMEGKHCYAGNRKLMQAAEIEIGDFADDEESFAASGKTPLYFAQEKKFLGIIAVADVVKPTSKQAIAELSSMGIDTIMITGDNAKTAEAIRRQVGIKSVIVEVLPQDKERKIRTLVNEKYHASALLGILKPCKS